MKAVKRGHVEVANELRTRGADKTIKNKNGDTVYQLTLNKDLLAASVSGDAATLSRYSLIKVLRSTVEARIN